MTGARLFVVVPAAGGGSRFGGELPKQYASLAGRPVIAHALDRLAALQAETTVVVLAPGDAHYARLVGARPGVEVTADGGATRTATVANALARLAARCARRRLDPRPRRGAPLRSARRAATARRRTCATIRWADCSPFRSPIR